MPLGQLACGVMALVTAACGPLNRVTGTVMIDGQPLPAGSVTFLCEGTGRPVISSAISEAGVYEIVNPPVGRARVAVKTFKPQPKPEPGVSPTTGIDYSLSWEDTGPYVPIPERYGSPHASGLECTIVGGTQAFDISLAR